MTEADISLSFNAEVGVAAVIAEWLPDFDFFCFILILWYTLCLITAYTFDTIC